MHICIKHVHTRFQYPCVYLFYDIHIYVPIDIWDKLFKSGVSKFCGRQPLKNLLTPLLNTLSHICLLY